VLCTVANPHPRRAIVIYLDGLPEPPAHSGWWDPATLGHYVMMSHGQFVHTALEMRDAGATKEDWEYLAELSKAVALRAWDETEKGG